MLHIHRVLPAGCTLAVYACVHVYACTLCTLYWPFVVQTQYVHMYVVCKCTVTVYVFVHMRVHTHTVDPRKWMYNHLLCVYTCVQNYMLCTATSMYVSYTSAFVVFQKYLRNRL